MAKMWPPLYKKRPKVGPPIQERPKFDPPIQKYIIPLYKMNFPL